MSLRWVQVSASALLVAKRAGFSAALWASAAERFRLRRSASVSAAAAIPAFQLRHNKSLHPTVTAPFVPHFAYTAGEFRRCVASARRFCQRYLSESKRQTEVRSKSGVLLSGKLQSESSAQSTCRLASPPRMFYTCSRLARWLIEYSRHHSKHFCCSCAA